VENEWIRICPSIFSRDFIMECNAMRCRACDKLLSRFESVKKDSVTKEHLDLCSHCQIMSTPAVVEAIEEYDNFMYSFVDIQSKV
jgi:predicted anti-sigma-YlaC factor YlaD